MKPSAAAAKSLQSCLTLFDPIDGSPPGSPFPGILKARTLEWVAISFSSAQLFIELFTREKDLTAEATVEATLKANGLTWYKQTDFLSDELIFQTTYEMEVLINGE